MAGMIHPDRQAAADMWAAYRDAHPEVQDEALVVETFGGDSPDLADELLQFVLDGHKRATAAMVAEFVSAGEPLPRLGGHWIACDGAGQPRVVLRSIELRMGPMSSVDERFAWDEGEYDRTLQSWLDGHRRYFGRVCQTMGLAYSDDIEVCFERFRVVWPQELAD